MLAIYDKTHRNKSPLINYSDYYIERAKGQLDLLHLSINLNSPEYQFIQREGYIGTEKYGEYVIKEINLDDEAVAEVVADLNVEDIKGHRIDSFETVEQSVANTTNMALNGTGWAVGTCNVTRLRTVRKNNVTAWDVLTEIQSAFNCEMEFNTATKHVNIYQHRGQNRGVYFSEQLNLKQVSSQGSSRDYVTCLVPIGKDGLTIVGVNNGVDYLVNHQYSNKNIFAFWSDNRYTVAQDLKDDAQERLDYLSKPVIGYSCSILDLAKSSPDKYTILDYDYGDIITLLASSKNIKEQQRIVKVDIHPDEPEKNTCEIANRTASLDSLDVRFLGTADTVDNVTNQNGTIDGSKVECNPNADLGTANIQDLNAVMAKIGAALITKLTATDLEAINASIENLTTNKADITNLNVTNENVDKLTTNTGIIIRLLSDNATIDDLTSDTILANYAALTHGTIGYAQIAKVKANSIDSGDLNTALINIMGTDGRMKMHDNRIQVFSMGTDGKLFERIALGDVNGDGTEYGIRIRSSDGVTMLYDENGATKEGFTSGWGKVSDGTLDGKKLDISTVITQINSETNTKTIDYSKIQVDQKTLDVELSEMNTSLNGKATPKEITDAINGLEVGIKNLVLNSVFMNETKTQYWAVDSSHSSVLTNDYNGKNVLKTDCSTLNVSAFSDSIQTIPNIQPSKDYSFSLYAKGTCVLYLEEHKSDGSLTSIYSAHELDCSNTNAYKLFSNSFTTQPDCAQFNLVFRVYGTCTAWSTLYMLVEGNKGADWMPSPDDIQSQLNTQAAEIQANAAQISLKVSTSSYTSDLSKTSADISNLQNGITDVNASIDSTNASVTNIKDQLADMPTNSSMNAAVETIRQIATEAKEESDNLSVTVSEIYQGGTNRVRNSSGLNDTSGWNKTGTITIDTIKSGELSSGKCFSLGDNSTMSQQITIAANKVYTITCKYLKTSSAAEAYLEITDNSKVYKVFDTLDSVDVWSTASFTFIPEHSVITLSIHNLTSKLSVADIMLAEGQIKSNWTPAFNEIYIETVKMDSSGITVSNNDDSQFSTHVGTASFSIAHQGTTVVQIDSDIALLNAANVRNTLQIANIEFIPRTDGSKVVDLAYFG